MGNLVEKNSPGASIIAEEERLYGQVQARVAMGEEDDGRPQLDGSDLDRDLLSLRDQISEARAEDLPPLIEQMTRLAALRARLGGGRSLPVDITSPYFAHMRLREHGKSRDVMIGKRGFIDRQSNVQIVDWRNAPISRIYYRYEEGDDYEEEIAGRRVEGMVEARRNISIAKGNLRRIGAPQGTYLKNASGGWVEAVGTLAPVLHGGMGKARGRARAARQRAARIHRQVIRDDRPPGEKQTPPDRQGAVRLSRIRRAASWSSSVAPAPARPPRAARIAYRFQDNRRFSRRTPVRVAVSVARPLRWGLPSSASRACRW